MPGRRNRPQDPNALKESRFPADTKLIPQSLIRPDVTGPRYPQVVGINFDGVTGPNETGAFPPDSMGAVGPTQFIVFVNGRLRSFNKTTGAKDLVLDVNPDTFFASVMTPESAPALNFTSDPQIRFDRLTKRWILQIIDVPSSDSSNLGDIPNRVLIAVSDAASIGVISSSTVWTFFYFQQNTVGGANTGEFLDYDSLGVDDNALYIGGNMFTASTGLFANTSAFVVRKSSILSNGPIVVAAFRNLGNESTDGPYSPRGVDNYDASANEGYFIGPSILNGGQLILRRVADPGGTPTISTNIVVTVNTTSQPISVDHLGNLGGTNGRLDAIDDRLFAAHIRSGRLWTAHNIAVDATGVASDSDPQRRDAVRWYELIVPVNVGIPTVNQSGTIFDNASTLANARQFWMPSVTVSGQGHAALGFSVAGTPYHVNAATAGRLLGETLGNLDTPTLLTNSSTPYNPPNDSGAGGARRWGDYSFTSLDPNDDMTMWTVQEFCDGTNTYGVEVAKLFAPPPATPATASGNVPLGQNSTTVTITGVSVSGSGFFDPGAGFANRIGASVSGGSSGSITVNSVTYNSPTQVMLDVNTTAATNTAYDVTITNPDGQARTGPAILAAGTGTAGPPPTPTPTPSPTPLPTPTPAPNFPYGVILSPTPGPLSGSTVTFTWSAGSAKAYMLMIGDKRVTEPGGSNIFSSGQTGGHSRNVTSLPTDGRTLYVRLWSLVSGQWYTPPQDYQYTAFPGRVISPVISPASGTYRTSVKVNIATGTPGASIYYTLNGSTPTSSSTKFTAGSPFTVTGKGSHTVKAIAINGVATDSSVISVTYTIN
jgi:hypothetical protein